MVIVNIGVCMKDSALHFTRIIKTNVHFFRRDSDFGICKEIKQKICMNGKFERTAFFGYFYLKSAIAK